ncbi:MAG TPA: hypothetical protein DEO70_05915 [Bacteroidales bacterium]|nr:MAG: hypothetical protein A2X11_11390 [Bacteroidetes bacterium GWE2_42_24]HBZ66357.1 hypothetical protein [Bacteroidales bacterium]
MKMQFSLIRFFSALFFTAVLITSCSKDNNPDKPTVVTPVYSGGAFICNEGAFMQGNATLDFFSYTTTAVVSNVFQSINQRPIGDVLQSMSVIGDYGYLVVNNSNKIEVVTMQDMKEAGVIEGVTAPRYIIKVADNKAYVSQWGDDGKIQVVDMKTLEVVKTIETGLGPEQMIIYNDLVYVANGGGWAADSTITVINPTNDVVVGTIKVGYNPKSFAVDAGGSLWVLCYGHIIYDPVTWAIASEMPSELVKLSGTSLGVDEEKVIGISAHPTMLAASPDGNTFYYGGGFGFSGIYAWDNQSGSLPTTPISDKMFYGFGVNPDNGEILGLEAPSFTGPGVLYRFSPDGTQLGQYPTGIGPNSVVFY